MPRLPKPVTRHKLLSIAAMISILVLATVLYFWLHKPAKVATIPSSNPASATKQPSGRSQTSANTPATGKTEASSTTPATISGNPPAAPYGNFVSNHHPGQNGSPTTETSTCNTTPGATCYIQFTNGSLTRTLASQTTDSNGGTYWDWDISSAGLTKGSWQIAAVATLNGQTQTAKDSTLLEIQ